MFFFLHTLCLGHSVTNCVLKQPANADVIPLQPRNHLFWEGHIPYLPRNFFCWHFLVFFGAILIIDAILKRHDAAGYRFCVSKLTVLSITVCEFQKKDRKKRKNKKTDNYAVSMGFSILPGGDVSSKRLL
jgi:hypothetical protein